MREWIWLFQIWNEADNFISMSLTYCLYNVYVVYCHQNVPCMWICIEISFDTLTMTMNSTYLCTAITECSAHTICIVIELNGGLIKNRFRSVENYCTRGRDWIHVELRVVEKEKKRSINAYIFFQHIWVVLTDKNTHQSRTRARSQCVQWLFQSNLIFFALKQMS